MLTWYSTLYNIKITFVNITAVPPEPQNWGANELTVADASFPKFQFSLESLSLIIGNKFCQLFSLKWQVNFVLSFFFFLRKCLPNIQVWVIVICLSVVLSSRNDVLWKKWLIRLTKAIVAVLFPEVTPTLLYTAKGLLCMCFPPCHEECSEQVDSGPRFNKAVIFYCITTNNLKWSWSFFVFCLNHEYIAVKNTVTI